MPSSSTPSASKLKRRYEPDEESRESSLDPSPPPDRPKKGPPKRARVTQLAREQPAADSHDSGSHNDIDIGVLLASLPPESLLPILTALVKEQPSLKSSILPLIPRPTLNTAIDALATAARQLREAYPYSNSHSSASSPSPSPQQVFPTNHSFGSGFSVFGSAMPARPATSFTPRTGTDGSGMRDTYIQSRLRPHIEKFVAACMSYLPYFSNITSSTLHPIQSSSSSLQIIHRDKASISETYDFLSHLTSHILSQPPLTQASLVPMLLPRLTQEWFAWVNRVDEHVNRQAGMFGTDSATAWSRGLDEFCRAKTTTELQELMQNVRKKWVGSVGWLIGRFPSPEPMDV